MKTDQELLREFVRSHAEQAFAELVNRHIGLVHGAALRETKGNDTDARDVTQLVFIELARKAATLQRHPTLAGWLYTSVRFVSANARRAEHRRLLREQEAYTMSELQHSPHQAPEWEELKPVLDDAMHELNEDDRTAVILRFFEGKTLREIGDTLRLTENTARMRVDRALNKLQKLLARRGIQSTDTTLAKTLPAGIAFASADLVAGVTGSAITAALATTAGTSTLLGTATMAKLKLIGAGTLLVATAGIITWEEVQRRDALKENERLRGAAIELTELREENSRLLQQAQNFEEIRSNELRELSQLRGQVSSRRNNGTVDAGNTNSTSRENWRDRFNAAYQLQAGEVLRRVRMGPERENFIAQSSPARPGRSRTLLIISSSKKAKLDSPIRPMASAAGIPRWIMCSGMQWASAAMSTLAMTNSSD